MIKGSGLHGSCFHLHLSVEFSSEVSRLQRASAGFSGLQRATSQVHKEKMLHKPPQSTLTAAERRLIMSLNVLIRMLHDVTL